MLKHFLQPSLQLAQLLFDELKKVLPVQILQVKHLQIAIEVKSANVGLGQLLTQVPF